MDTGVGAKPQRASALLAALASRTKWATWSRKISSPTGSWRSAWSLVGATIKLLLGAGDSGRIDDLAPARDFRFQEQLKFGRRAFADGAHAKVFQAAAHIIHANDSINRIVELDQDRLRRPARCDHTLPCREVKTGNGVGKRRHVGQGGKLLFGGYRKCTQLSPGDQWQRGTKIAEHELNVAAHQIGQRR